MSLISRETLNQYWDQFEITGFPHGITYGDVPLRSTAYQLSVAQLKALQTTAVQLVAAPVTGGGIATPPAGYWLQPRRLSAEYIFGTTAYTINNSDNDFQIEYVGKTTALLSMAVTGLVDQTASTTAVNYSTTPSSKIAVTNVANLGLEVKLIGTGAALTLGDGLVNLFLEYSIVALF